MSNLTTVYIRLAFKKGSDNIHVGFTQLGNKTLTGEIMASDDLIVNHQLSMTGLSGEGAVGKVGTICIASDEEADRLIEEIDSIQAGRPVNARGNKYPFVYLEVLTEGDIIFNRGLNGGVDRLTFLDVECVEVHADAPEAVVQIEKPVVRSSSMADARAANSYGTVSYREVRKSRLAQMEAAAHSVRRTGARSSVDNTTPLRVENAFPTEAHSPVPTFNTKTIDVVKEGSESKDSPDSQQDKLNAIAVAMKAAGMSGAEIAQALKKELELVF